MENKTVALAINGTKLTGRMIKSGVAQYLAHRKNAKQSKARAGPVKPCGKQSVRQLAAQGKGLSNITIDDPSIREFDRIARKYGVDYAIKRDKGHTPPRFLVFFKAQDSAALTAAFSEYTGKKIKKASRPSVLQKLANFKDMVRDTAERVRKKVLER